ncbi:hypothetical protein [Listeria booriae]|uniref:hypothetical protein n=1 Tax=Listeria booriae TaxID=1552123 RepID=UPI001624872E|nr:hypothetical protein [Listeria booriae]MBC2676312.1 hypothetical protein [Listeria booriae]
MTSFRNSEDRGMAKWQGFLLSEHTANMEMKKRAPKWHDVMEQEVIYHVLHKVLKNQSVITIQTFKSDGDSPDPYIEGRIIGVDGDEIYVQTVEGVKTVELEMIRYAEERSFQKWYNQ